MPREQTSTVPLTGWNNRTECEKSKKRVKPKSILEKFDRIASVHLDKYSRRGCVLSSGFNEVKVQKESVAPKDQRLIKFVTQELTNSISSVEIVEQVKSGMQSEMLDAVNKLIRAEEIDKFAEVVAATEAAVASVPPELAEEAALAIAHGYQTQSVTTIKENIPGDTVIQVLGYIGIRKGKRESEHIN